MQQITETLLQFALTFISTLAFLAFREFKRYALTKGGKQAVEIIEIVARNAVNAVEQIAKTSDVDKFDTARRRVISELSKYDIHLTESQLETFIESAVKKMNDGWNGGAE